MPHDLAQLRRVAEQVAGEAAALVGRRRLGGVEVADRKSSAVDVVTAVDRESEALLRSRLAELRPGDGFFGEEGTRSGSRTGLTWVVDPIDGTVNFLYGIPHFAVSVAVVDDEERSLAGAVVEVTSRRVFSAALDGGATLDGVPLRVRPPVPMAERLFVTGFQYQQRVRELQGAAVARLVGQVRDVRRMGSAALDMCFVGAGMVDAYVEEGTYLWDRAAGTLVAAEAGAKVVVTRGVGGMDCVVCAPEHSFGEVLAVVRDCGFLGEAQATGDPAE